MKVKSFKPLTEPVEIDGVEGKYELRAPSEEAYCAWNDARLSQAKFDDSGKTVQHTALFQSTRALLVGLCLFNGDQRPVGEEWVRTNLTAGSISEMYNWLFDAGGFDLAKDLLKNSPPAT